MCQANPFHSGIFKNPNIRVCIKIPFREERTKPDFFDCIPKDDLFREHQGIHKKGRRVSLDWAGY